MQPAASRKTSHLLLTVSAFELVVVITAALTIFVLHRNAEIGRLDGSSHASGGPQRSGMSVPSGGVISAGGKILCVTGKYPATITSVTPVRPFNEFVVQGWGVRPNPWHDGAGDALGADDKPLSAHPSFGHQQVTGKCGMRQVWSEFAVQVSRTGTETAMTNGFRVHYRINGRTGSFVWRHVMFLCSPDDRSEDCPSPPS